MRTLAQTRGRTSRVLILLLLLLGCLVSLSASAQSNPKEEQAREYFERGRALMNDELWEAAITQFTRSRELFPARGNTLNIAVCLRKAQRLDEALEMFQTLLREFPNMPRADEAGVRAEIDWLRAHLGTIELVDVESGANVLVDGRDRGMTPTPPIRVSGGQGHLVRVLKDGFEPLETRLEVPSGETVRLPAKLRPLTKAGQLTVVEAKGGTLRVLVDSVDRGQTPWTGRVAEGKHYVALKGDKDLGTQPTQVGVIAHKETTLSLTAEPLECELHVEPVPSNARVALDGVTLGSGAWHGRVRAGGHVLEANAEGFVNASRSLLLGSGERRKETIVLDRDPSSPLWQLKNPPRFVFELTAGLAVTRTLGGEVAGECGSCSAPPPLGFLAAFRAGYQFSSGLGLMLDVGYLRVTEELEGRTTTLTPLGLPPVPGTANDTIVLRGPMLGAAAALHRGADWPITGRLGAGVLLGSVIDTRSGTFTATGCDATLTQGSCFSAESSSTGVPGVANVSPLQQSSRATYVYVEPELRIGKRLGERWEASFGVAALAFIAISSPTWSKEASFNVPRPGPRDTFNFSQQTMGAPIILFLVPSLALRYEYF